MRISLAVFAELMNEVWNPTFRAWSYIREVGFTAGRLSDAERNSHDGTIREYAYAHDRVMADVEAGFTSGRQLVRVYGCQLEPSAYFYMAGREHGAQRVDAVAVALYWGISNAELPAQRTPANLKPLYRRALDAVESAYMSASTIILDLGLRCLAYEFNQDLATAPDLSADDRVTFCRSTEARELWDDHLAWQAINIGDVTAQYADAPSPASGVFCWGLDEYQGQPIAETPRRAALLDAIAANT